MSLICVYFFNINVSLYLTFLKHGLFWEKQISTVHKLPFCTHGHKVIVNEVHNEWKVVHLFVGVILFFVLFPY